MPTEGYVSLLGISMSLRQKMLFSQKQNTEGKRKDKPKHIKSILLKNHPLDFLLKQLHEPSRNSVGLHENEKLHLDFILFEGPASPGHLLQGC